MVKSYTRARTLFIATYILQTISTNFTQIMIINLPLIQTLLLKLPLNHNLNNITFLSTNATYYALKHELKMLARDPDRSQKPILMSGSEPDPVYNDGFSQVDKVVKNELLDSGIDPLQIGYSVDEFGFEAPRQDFEFGDGDGDGGNGDGGYGSGGNDGQGPGNPDSNDGLTSVACWWYWQWNRAIRAQKRSRTTLHFTYNNRHQLVDLAVLMLTSEVLPPRDMTKATLATIQAIEDLLPLLLQILYFPIVFPLVLSEFQENEAIFAATVYGIFGASVAVAVVFSGAVVYGLWRWHGSLHNNDSGEDDTDPVV